MSEIYRLHGTATPGNGSATTAIGQEDGPSGVTSPETYALLAQRGLDSETGYNLGVQTLRRRNGGLDHAWVAIPTRIKGQAVGWEFRRIHKGTDGRDFYQQKGSQQHFRNIDVLDDHTLDDEPLTITEGVFDMWSAIQSGAPRTISVPGGGNDKKIKNGGDLKYAYVDEVLPRLQDVKRIVLATDSDVAGDNLATDLARRLGIARCYRASFPDGCKDLNDVLRQHGPLAVVECINGAKPFPVPGLVRMADLPKIEQRIGYAPNIPGMDAHYRPRLGDVTIVTGIPGHGKTTVINAIACSLAMDYGWRVCAASYEQEVQTDFRRYLRTWFGKKPEADQTDAELAAADEWIDHHFDFCIPINREEMTLDWQMEVFATSAVRNGSNLMILDPWNKLNHVRQQGESEHEYIGRSLDSIKNFAMRFKKHIIIAAHPAKMDPQSRTSNRAPTPYDISGSAHWFNAPDMVCVVHQLRPKGSRWITEFRVEKSKYHDVTGEPGMVQYHYSKATGRFSKVESDFIPKPDKTAKRVDPDLFANNHIGESFPP